MTVNEPYDVAIVGGGLAGLSAAILLSRQGHSVALFEKEQYPFHKVCGEYVSMESWDFLEQLGLPLGNMDLPIIDTLFLTAASGREFSTKLPLGGFGISRYKLDAALAAIARNSGVHLFEKTKVRDIRRQQQWEIEVLAEENEKQNIISRVCCAAYGKRSNLDIKKNREFLRRKDKRLDNHVAVKYHIKTDWPLNCIGLHNFEGGYCGISAIGDNTYCLCYLTKADALRSCNGDLSKFQQTVMSRNRHLEKIFRTSTISAHFPITISQVSYASKTQVEDGIIMLGDAAGMITPLCGNGMSMALHSAKIAAACIHEHLEGRLSRKGMENRYQSRWRQQFAGRLRTGRALQGFFGKSRWSEFFVSVFRNFPALARPVVKMTHGKPF